MLKRKAYEKLLEWKQQQAGKTAILIEGARRVGKSTLAKEFGLNEYKSCLVIDFFQAPDEVKQYFRDYSNDFDALFLYLSAYYSVELFDRESLVVFDEVQMFPFARGLVKYLVADGRYDYVETGSLLSIKQNIQDIVVPSEEQTLELAPFDFEEFLWGMGISEDMIGKLCGYLHSKTVIPEAIHSQMMNYYRQYVATGGMPEVVQKYINTKDFREVDKVQRSLLQGYQYDIAHYATAEEKVKAEKCYLSLAKQLLDKENHKFQYKEIEHGGRAQKYYSSVEWLLRADMVQLCKLVTDVRFDLDDYARDDFFRAYTTDLSLLMAMKDFSLKQHIVENTLTGNSKGGIYECAIADALYKKGYQIYFYKNETARKEIDVIIQKDGKIVPIEVKSGNTQANSLKWLMKNNKNISYGYKFADGNIGVSEEGIITLPLYMVAFI